MGVNFGKLLDPIKKETSIKAFANQKIGIDAYNMIYSFLTTIRTSDVRLGGGYFTDSKGNVTSHLIGMFNRLVYLMEHHVKPAVIFDGEPPSFKKEELESRKAQKERYEEMKEAALAQGDLETAARLAARTTRITTEMVEDARRLCTLLGIPVVQAPSEAEAQIARMCHDRLLHHSASQDYDSLLFGTPSLLMNFAISPLRRKSGGSKVQVPVYQIMLKQVLEYLELESREQLILMGMLIGTDYNKSGIKGIGPKTALKVVKKCKTLDKVLDEVQRRTNQPLEELFPHDPRAIHDFFVNPPVKPITNLEWNEIDQDGLIHFLVEERDFNDTRVRSKLRDLAEKRKQKTLDSFFG